MGEPEVAIEALIGTVAASSGVSVWLARRVTREALRRDLNRVAHEMRRPLQALALNDTAPPTPFSYSRTRAELLDQALDALEELNALANGPTKGAGKDLVRVRDLLAARLEALPMLAGSDEVRCHWEAGAALVEGSRVELSRALDNVLVNAVEHGSPPVVITGSAIGNRLRITISDSGAERPSVDEKVTARAGRTAVVEEGRGIGRGRRVDPRRGHGLRIVESILHAHGGRVALSKGRSGSVVVMDLPLARLDRLGRV